MTEAFGWFIGIDWGYEAHATCVQDAAGEILDARPVLHTIEAVNTWIAMVLTRTAATPATIAVAIEKPEGVLVDTLIEHGFAVFSINPKQLDRFRDRYSPAGAKDDRRDALVLADSLRTDLHCFH